MKQEKKRSVEKDAETISVIQQGLKSMDNIPIQSPDLQWFEQFVRKEKQLVRKK
ncbi:hypothetical protein ACQYAD_07735 [Neobacillus sp. SM06]|uniref:hypothetical protein n=1 Tax=Neobacillus sp. SM06 TaxID=3422492 RepID=UPI003D2971A1